MSECGAGCANDAVLYLLSITRRLNTTRRSNRARPSLGGAERVHPSDAPELPFVTSAPEDCRGNGDVARSLDGGAKLLEPSRGSSTEGAVAPVRPSPLCPAVMTTTDAIELLNLGDEPFVFFLDAGSHRARVVYRRYDPRYGPIVPSDEPSVP